MSETVFPLDSKETTLKLELPPPTELGLMTLPRPRNSPDQIQAAIDIALLFNNQLGKFSQKVGQLSPFSIQGFSSINPEKMVSLYTQLPKEMIEELISSIDRIDALTAKAPELNKSYNRILEVVNRQIGRLSDLKNARTQVALQSDPTSDKSLPSELNNYAHQLTVKKSHLEKRLQYLVTTNSSNEMMIEQLKAAIKQNETQRKNFDFVKNKREIYLSDLNKQVQQFDSMTQNLNSELLQKNKEKTKLTEDLHLFRAKILAAENAKSDCFKIIEVPNSSRYLVEEKVRLSDRLHRLRTDLIEIESKIDLNHKRNEYLISFKRNQPDEIMLKLEEESNSLRTKLRTSREAIKNLMKKLSKPVLAIQDRNNIFTGQNAAEHPNLNITTAIQTEQIKHEVKISNLEARIYQLRQAIEDQTLQTEAMEQRAWADGGVELAEVYVSISAQKREILRAEREVNMVKKLSPDLYPQDRSFILSLLHHLKSEKEEEIRKIQTEGIQLQTTISRLKLESGFDHELDSLKSIKSQNESRLESLKTILNSKKGNIAKLKARLSHLRQSSSKKNLENYNTLLLEKKVNQEFEINENNYANYKE